MIVLSVVAGVNDITCLVPFDLCDGRNGQGLASISGLRDPAVARANNGECRLPTILAPLVMRAQALRADLARGAAPFPVDLSSLLLAQCISGWR